MPFSHEFTRTRRKLGYVMDNDSIRTARDAWLADATAAEATYGHISTWDVSGVTDMKELFSYEQTFNDDIGAWDTSGVTTMEYMFWLKDDASLNNFSMSVTPDTSQVEI